MPSLVDQYLLYRFYHLEGKWLLAETQVLCRNETIQEDIDACTRRQWMGSESVGLRTFSDGVRHRDDTIHGWLVI